MSKKSALGGQGIDALLSLDKVEAPKGLPSEGVENIDIAAIRANPEQPRKHFPEESLQELAQSIQGNGVIQPILLEKKGSHYEIVAGERRYRASILAGKTTIPALVRGFTENEKLEIALIENIQREDLNPLEEALAYRNIIDKLGMSQQVLASRVGKKRSTIANSLRLLNLPQKIQEKLDSGAITPGHGRAILAVVNYADQIALAEKIEAEGLTVREAEGLVAAYNGGKRLRIKQEESPAPGRGKVPELVGIEQKFIDHFGTKVQIKGTLEKGKIEISYFSQEDLTRIFEILS